MGECHLKQATYPLKRFFQKYYLPLFYNANGTSTLLAQNRSISSTIKIAWYNINVASSLCVKNFHQFIDSTY